MTPDQQTPHSRASALSATTKSLSKPMSKPYPSGQPLGIGPALNPARSEVVPVERIDLQDAIQGDPLPLLH